MSYKVYLAGSLDAVEWSQVVWKAEDGAVREQECEQERIHPIMMAALPRQGLIVDAGCGTGRVPLYFTQRGYRVVGVEISHDACVIANRQQPGVKIIQADAGRLPLRSHSVDAVVSLGVVEHNEAGPLDALRELHRVLKPTGTLILTVPFNNLFRRLVVNRLMDYVTRRRRRGGCELRFAEYRFTRREMETFLRQAAFDVVSAHPEDALPPRTVGLWVDYTNLTLRHGEPADQFMLPGLLGVVARRLLHWAPWLVCGEVAFVASAK